MQKAMGQPSLYNSQKKTKIIKTKQTPYSEPLYIAKTELSCSILSKDGDIDREVNTRLAKLAIVLITHLMHGKHLVFSWAEDQVQIMTTAICP